ncbi:GGDEF domain-containing protein [Paractinoplanes deccanensis]|uniref:GGDEF domain-containing protein n=1 Tax=Paractinoplanes deccanensis TaxID=113561 RepID=UPI001943969C|nr:GGDEF domain-containing protein [Actinoplanes deccanensis]
MIKNENLIPGASVLVAALWWIVEPTARGGLEAVAVLVMMLLAWRLLARRSASLRALRRAVAREQVLSELGTVLITTTDEAEVHRHAVHAAEKLLAECPGARASLAATAGDGFAITDSAGEGKAAVLGRQVPVASVPADVLARLRGGEVVRIADMAAAGYADVDEATSRPYTLLPLINGERFFGVLSVSALAELPTEVFQALQALRTQVSLALGSVALTAELTERALHDPLTGLGNRAMLRERLTAAMARSRRSGRPVGALLLDLNGFKQVNDAHGHLTGDELLRVVAERLRGCVRTEDVVARLGGDEFVVIVEDLRSARDAVVIADRIVAALDEAVTVGRRELRTPASVGIALSHADVTDPDELLRMADTAMYAAKRRGGGSYELHGAPVAPEPSPVAAAAPALHGATLTPSTLRGATVAPALPHGATVDRRRPKLPV